MSIGKRIPCRRGQILLGSVAALGLYGAAGSAPVLDDDGADWSSYGRTAQEQRYSPLKEISRSNAASLGLAWSLDLDAMTTLEGTPLAIDGVLYFTGTRAVVFAVDAASGKLLWRYDPDVPQAAPARMRLIFGANRGLAYASGKLFLGATDGRLICISARTGEPLWAVDTLPPDSTGTITGAPRVFGNKVVIGQGGADFGFRGYVTAYDIDTGRRVWRFYTVPGDPKEGFENDAMKRAAKTWAGEWWKYGGGGTPWNALTYDAELGRLYVGTGNSSPYDPRIRTQGKGDNLFLASIVALDAETGRYLWHYQVNPQESWDYKATADIILADLVVKGRRRKVLMQAPTNGFFYVLDRTNGRLISAQKIGKVTWAKAISLKTGRPIEAPDIRYATAPLEIWPSALGAHSWQAMSYNPILGLAYVPYMHLGSRFSRLPGAQNILANGNHRYGNTTGVNMEFFGENGNSGTGALLAWDVAAAKVRWRVNLPEMWNGGTLTTAGSLVFQGTAEGALNAYDATDGVRLWSFDAKLGIIAPPISYSAAGHQQISVLVGWGGSTFSGELMPQGWKYGLQPRRMLTFSVQGDRVLPPTPPGDRRLHPVFDDRAMSEPRTLARGSEVFGFSCLMCHGNHGVAAGLAPDLRESTTVLDREAFATLLRRGLLVAKGMPMFDELSDGDIEALQQYIWSRAKEAAAH